jgi:hypothetical protein
MLRVCQHLVDDDDRLLLTALPDDPNVRSWIEDCRGHAALSLSQREGARHSNGLSYSIPFVIQGAGCTSATLFVLISHAIVRAPRAWPPRA